MKPWQTLSRQMILDHSKYLKIEQHRIDTGTHGVIDDWPWVIAPDYVNVVAVTAEGRFICFRQTKYAIEGTSIAPVGGYVEPGDSVRETAERELREETGYMADDWTFLGSFPVDSSRGVGAAHFFLARNATFVGEVDSDDLEPQEFLLLTRDEIETAIDAGDVKTLPWVSVFALALRKC